jgi:hypothetical protein
MLAVLAHTTVTGTHVAPFLTILLQAGRHSCKFRSTKQAEQRRKEGAFGRLSPFGQTLTMPCTPNEQREIVRRNITLLRSFSLHL